MVVITEFEKFYHQQVIDHVLDIENKEFNMNLTLDMQPDIKDIAEKYRRNNGNFWVALRKGRVIGTTGIYYLSPATVELRRMFVKQEYRGKEHAIGQKLLDTAITWSKYKGYQAILLETTEWLAAATRFYIKNNFQIIDRDELPANFPLLRTTGIFMKLKI